MKPLRVVVDDEEARIGLMEEAEAKICRPEFGAVVVLMLNEGLGEESRREIVGHASAGQVCDETAPGKIDVVSAPPERGGEGIASPEIESRSPGRAVSSKEPADRGSDAETDRGPTIRVIGECHFVVPLETNGNDHAVGDLEGGRDAFPGHVVLPETRVWIPSGHVWWRDLPRYL